MCVPVCSTFEEVIPCTTFRCPMVSLLIITTVILLIYLTAPIVAFVRGIGRDIMRELQRGWVFTVGAKELFSQFFGSREFIEFQPVVLSGRHISIAFL